MTSFSSQVNMTARDMTHMQHGDVIDDADVHVMTTEWSHSQRHAAMVLDDVMTDDVMKLC